MLELNASTILSILETQDEQLKTMQAYNRLEPQDILMLIGPNTDIDLLVRELHKMANNRRRYNKGYSSSISDLYLVVLKYMLLHYPEKAKAFLYDIVDFDAIDFFLKDFGMKHSKSTMKLREFSLNIVQKEIKPIIQEILDIYINGLKEWMKLQTGLVFVNKEYSSLASRISDYIEHECEGLYITEDLIVNITDDLTATKENYKKLLSNIKTIVSPIYLGRTDAINITFRLDANVLNLKSMPGFKSLPKKIRYAISHLDYANKTFQARFQADGKIFSDVIETGIKFVSTQGGNLYKLESFFNEKIDPFEYEDKKPSDEVMATRKAMINKINNYFKKATNGVAKDLKALKVKVIPIHNETINGDVIETASESKIFQEIKNFFPKSN